VSRKNEGTNGNENAEAPILLRLFTAGNAPNSLEAQANLKAICSECLSPGEYQLEVVDVLEEPLRALEDGVLVTPTLIRHADAPLSVVGTLSDHEKVKQALGLEKKESSGQ